MRILAFATGNAHKLEELEGIISSVTADGASWSGFRLKGLKDYPQIGEIEETGSSFRENALIKAQALYDYTGHTSLSEDSGLVVSALEGRPGIYSARYAGVHGDANSNMDKLLEEMDLISDRRCYFHSCICILDQSGPQYFEGNCHGTLLQERSGDGGFGYDPIFMPEGFRDSFAILSPEIKNRISHRSRAMALLRDFLRSRSRV